MRYEGVLRATTSAALICGLVLVLSECGRVPSHVGPSPVAEISASPTSESAATASPSADTTGSTPPPAASTPPPTGRSTPPPATIPPVSIGSLNFPSGEVGIAYPTISLAASGGRPPYSWSISSGALPTPLAISANTISGTPSAAGPFSFTVQVTDSAGGTASVAQSITVAVNLAVSGTCTTQCSVEEGCVTVCGTFGSQSGGIGPYTYAVIGGALPGGMSLNGLSLTGPFPPGQIAVTGAPIPYKFSVKVTDSLGAQGGADAVFYVFPHIALQGGTCSAKAGSGFGCQVRLPYSGGSGKPVSVAISSSTPVPKGTTAILQSGIVLFSVPAQTTAVNLKALVILTDSAICGPNTGQPCTANATVVISIN